jgi:hypothetical protein
MGGGQGFDDLYGIGQGLVERQRTPLDDLRERLALDVLFRSNVVQRADIGMVQRRNRASLALETLTVLGPGNLDGNDAIKARVTSLLDFAHAARTDGCENFVRAEVRTGFETHIGRTVLPHEAAFLRHIAHISEPVKVATASTNLMAPPTADGRNRLRVLSSRQLNDWEIMT